MDVNLTRPAGHNESESTADQSDSFALIEIDGMAVVILAEFVISALVRPFALTRLPRSHAAIDGVFTYEEQVVPVVDIRNWLNPDIIQSEPLPYVMLLGTQGRVIGLAVDAVQGMMRIPRSHSQQIYRDTAEDRFFQNVVKSAKGEQLFSQLDPLCLMTQVEAWAQVTTGKDDNTGPHTAKNSGTQLTNVQQRTPPQVLVRSGTSILAIPAEHVGEVIAMPQIDNVFSLTDKLMGLTRWHDTTVAVVDMVGMLGLESTQQAAQLMLMLTDDALCAGLPVNEIIAVCSFTYSAIETATHIRPDYGQFYQATTVLDDGRRVMLLNSRAVLAACPLSDLSGNNSPKRSMVDAAVKQSNTLTGTHIVFSADVIWAISIAFLKEIIPVPANFKPALDNDRGLLGTCEWRSNYLPVLDPGTAGEVQSKKLIVVHYDGKDAGILVNDILELLPPHRGKYFSFTPPNGALVRMMTVDTSTDQRSYRIFDVAGLAYFQPA